MSHANTDRKKKGFASHFDKDVASPTIEPEATQYSFRKNSKAAHNLKRCTDESKVKPASNYVTIGNHEVRPVKELLSLEKKPLECYFEGLKGKSKSKKKIRQPKKKCLDVWDAKDSPAAHNEGWIPAVARAPPMESESNIVEERLQSRRMQAKIRHCERRKEQLQEKISMKQRLAEEKYLKQQENLAETWLGVVRRQSQSRGIISEGFMAWPPPRNSKGPTFRRTVSNKQYRRIDTSVPSKEFCSDVKEKEPLPRKAGREGKKPAVLQKKSILDDLDEDFCEKLVFIDTEDCGSDF